MDRETEQIAYYRGYEQTGWFFHRPPQLSLDVVEALAREHLDKKYRFTWGGVAVVRADPDQAKPKAIHGPREALEVNNGWIMPKYLFQRVAQPTWFAYKMEDGHTVRVARPEQVPPHIWAQNLVVREYEFVEFGQLRWFIEQLTPGADLVAARVYREADAPAEEWIAISPPLEDQDGNYFHPNLECVELLKKREWQNDFADLKEVLAEAARKREEKRVAKQVALEAVARTEMTDLAVDVLEHEAARTDNPGLATDLKEVTTAMRALKENQ